MAKKYHIDANGKVVPCQAFLRKCPRVDYNSQEAAYSAMYLQEEGRKLEEARAQVEKVMRDPNAHSAFIAADFTGDGHGKNTRKFAQKIDEEFFAKGEYPEKVYAVVPLNRKYINNKKNPLPLSLHRIPVADYDEGVITGRWTLETENKDRKIDPIVLDLENDFENEKDRAERYIRDVIMRTAPRDSDPKFINYETNYMINQLEDAFAQIEEEASGPYRMWEKNPSIGSFAHSDMFNINVDVDYNTTLFRGRTFDRFLNDENGYYTSVAPQLDIQVYDNENGKSDTSWRLVRYEGEWFLQTVDESGVPNPQKLIDAEDGYNKTAAFVRNHMNNNSYEIAEEKAKYVADLITEVEMAIDKNTRIKERREAQQRPSKDSSHRSLFGKSSSNTMDNILDLYA